MIDWKQIKVVMIDIDDTLLDFHAYVKAAMKSGFEKYDLGLFSEEKYQTFQRVNGGLWHDLEKGTLSFEELKRIRWNLVFRELGISFDGILFEEYFRKELHTSAIPVDGAESLLDRLSKNYLLCAASNGPYDQQLNRLKIGGMLSFFGELFISEAVGYSKPDLAFFDHCYKILLKRIPTLKKEEILMIGDSLTSDMSGAIGYGFKTCYYDYKGSGFPDDKMIDLCISSLRDLELIIEKNKC